MAVTGFHHTALRVRDIDASIRFYRDVLGLTLKAHWTMSNGQPAAMLDPGDASYIELFHDPQRPDDAGGGWLHIALRTDDVDATLEKARDAGCEVTIEPKDVTFQNTTDQAPPEIPIRLAFFKGPDGEVIELFDNAAL